MYRTFSQIINEEFAPSKFEGEESESYSLVGGKSDGMTLEDIAKIHKVPIEDLEKQVEIGLEIEKEHTTDERTARKITYDHLVEFCTYYSGLQELESKLEEEKKAKSNS